MNRNIWLWKYQKEKKNTGEQLQEWHLSIAPGLADHQDPSTYLPTA